MLVAWEQYMNDLYAREHIHKQKFVRKFELFLSNSELCNAIYCACLLIKT